MVKRRGRHRFNYLNAVPLRRWCERWVVPVGDDGAAELPTTGMATHKVRISDDAGLDDELRGWLREAYDRAC
jgi:hypothetical protein